MGGRISGVLLAAALGGVAALVLLLVYLLNAGNPTNALLADGVIALVFALVAYFARAITREPRAAQGASWGFAGLGFGLLFLTLLLSPSVSTLGRIVGLVLVLLALAVVLAGFGWRARGDALDRTRSVERASWDSRPPANALDYATATVPPAPPSTAPGEHR